MKQEVFKLKYEKYDGETYHTSTPLSYPHPNNTVEVGNIFGSNDESEYVSSRRKKRLVYIEKEKFNSEESYIENYGNPLARVSKQYVMSVIEKEGDKVSLKLFWGFRERRVGISWFKTSRNVDYITVNTRTGDVYVGFLHNFQKKRKATKAIRRNTFIGEPINTMKHKLRNIFSNFVSNHFDIINEILSKFMKEVDGSNSDDKPDFEKRLFKFYMDKRGIKYPNNFHLYSRELIGPKIRKELKKNDNRLVDAFMKSFGLSGKNLKKSLHNCTSLNIELYKFARKLFGDDWINQDNGFIINVLNSSVGTHRSLPAEFTELISKEELRRVFGLFKKVFFDGVVDSYTFYDHIRFYTELKLYGETDLKWMSDDSSGYSFRQEHLDWSDKLQFYKRGHYERLYPPYTYDLIETPINGYYPVVLNNSTNYNEESSIQSNCVKTYIGRPSSFIVSLRKGSKDSEERATIEYKLTKEGDKVKCHRVQSLGRFNGKLDESWMGPLFKLDEILLSYIRDKKFETLKITKKLSNGNVLNSNSHWDEQGQLRWSYRVIENNNSFFEI